MSDEDYTPFGPEWEAEVMKMRKADIVAMLRDALLAKHAATDAVPTNWLDPILTGPDAALSPRRAGMWDCSDVERLLRAVQKRIRELPEKAMEVEP